MVNPLACRSELRRLVCGPEEGELVPGIGVARFVVQCDDDASNVLSIVTATMKAVCSECVNGWSDSIDWRRILPKDFVMACASEMAPDEADQWLQRWQSMSEDERDLDERTRKWSLDSWIFWMDPGERAWQWWDAKIESEDRITVGVAIESWPFGWGAITWLFRGSGAIDIVPLELDGE